MNWTLPLIWSQIDAAARRAGYPWSPKTIVEITQKSNYPVFATLSCQVLGRWIDQEARSKGVFKWKDSVLKDVVRGNSLGGQTTQRGILVSIFGKCRR